MGLHYAEPSLFLIFGKQTFSPFFFFLPLSSMVLFHMLMGQVHSSGMGMQPSWLLVIIRGGRPLTALHYSVRR